MLSLLVKPVVARILRCVAPIVLHRLQFHGKDDGFPVFFGNEGDFKTVGTMGGLSLIFEHQLLAAAFLFPVQRRKVQIVFDDFIDRIRNGILFGIEKQFRSGRVIKQQS